MGLSARAQHALAVLAVVTGAGAFGAALAGMAEVDTTLAAAAEPTAAPSPDDARAVSAPACADPRRDGRGRF